MPEARGSIQTAETIFSVALPSLTSFTLSESLRWRSLCLDWTQTDSPEKVFLGKKQYWSIVYLGDLSRSAEPEKHVAHQL